MRAASRRRRRCSKACALLEQSDLRAVLPALPMPSLWIAGRRDRLVSPTAMREAAAMAPGSRYVDIAGGGHAPFLGHADQVADEIRDFMDNDRARRSDVSRE